MSMIVRAIFIISLSFVLSGAAFAQAQQPGTQTQNLVVTATAMGSNVRYASLGEVHQTRLQIFSNDGTQVFDSSFRLGNLIDWQLTDQQGTHLVDGSYLFLVTVKDFSNHLTQKYGTAILERDEVYLEQTERRGLSQLQASALEANRQADVLSTVDRLGAAGLNRTTIASTENPTASTPPPGQVETSGPTRGEINAASTGTLNYLSKWIDSSGTLGDSSILEGSGGSIGIGTSNFADPIFSTDKFKIVDGMMTFGFRDNFSGQGYFAVGSSANGIVGFVGHTNTTDGFTMGSYSNHKLTIRTNNANRLTIDTSGKVGIGTATPGQQLTVAGTIESTTGGFKFPNGQTQSSAGLPLSGGTLTGTLNLPANGLAIGTNQFVLSGGNVGVGTVNPQSKLDVNGSVNVAGDINVTGNALISGNIAAKYQDVAEWVWARQQMAAGTVVILDETRINSVVPSYRAYDTHIAGVVSAQPGLILGEGGSGKVMVATTGRVKVKVDASKHPIKIGDLLVTSGKLGVAMRSQQIRAGRALIHRPGTIIGKALEPLATGKGEILVLLSLQ